MLASDLHLIREKCSRAMIAYGLVPTLGLLLALAGLLAAQRAPRTSYAAALHPPNPASTHSRFRAMEQAIITSYPRSRGC